jgi:hypothetical protein
MDHDRTHDPPARTSPRSASLATNQSSLTLSQCSKSWRLPPVMSPEQYGNNSIEADHGRLKSRLQAMRGLKQLRCVQVITAGHAFIQNIRCGHYELGVEETVNLRVLAAFDELVMAI